MGLLWVYVGHFISFSVLATVLVAMEHLLSWQQVRLQFLHYIIDTMFVAPSNK